MNSHGLGWKESLESLHVERLQKWFRPVCAAPIDSIAFSIDYGELIPVNDQFHFNSCSGNAADTALTADAYIETGLVVNTSARACYLFALMEDGYPNGRGPDQGASIAGAALGTVHRGCVLEADFPYFKRTDGFSSSVPEEVIRKAIGRKMRSATPIQSYDEWLKFVGTFQGTVIFGIDWTDSLAAYRGDGPIISDRGWKVGGHALCAFEYEHIGGAKWPIVRNSHGRGWGRQGRMTVSPEVFDKWMKRSPYGAMGVSGSPSFAIRVQDMVKGAFQ